MPKEKKSYDNNGSRQRMVRIPTLHDEWLADLSIAKRRKDRDTRSGVATEIKLLIEQAYDEAHPGRKA